MIYEEKDLFKSDLIAKEIEERKKRLSYYAILKFTDNENFSFHFKNS